MFFIQCHTNLPVHIYINRINNRLVFKIKDRYRLELQTPENLKSFDSTKKLIEEKMNGENVSSLQAVQVLFQRNLAEKSVSKKV